MISPRKIPSPVVQQKQRVLVAETRPDLEEAEAEAEEERVEADESVPELNTPKKADSTLLDSETDTDSSSQVRKKGWKKICGF